MVKNTHQESQNVDFALGKQNYYLILLGFVIILIGLFLLTGGKTENPNEFSKEIFDFRRITLAPIIILGGFIFEIYAIMKKPKE
jgi:membrane-bound ClpP family serine protease